MFPQPVDILARTLYGEARPKDEADATAIAQVVLNRRKLPNWPDTIQEVCQQPYQFSCWNPDDPNRLRIARATTEDLWFKRCVHIARQAVHGKLPEDTLRLTHYHTRAVAPRWSRGKRPAYFTAGHLFFNDIDTPPPATAAEALEASRPLGETRTIRNAKRGLLATALAGGGGVAAVVTDAGHAVAGQFPKWGAALVIAGAVLAVAMFFGAIIHARKDDREEGRR